MADNPKPKKPEVSYRVELEKRIEINKSFSERRNQAVAMRILSYGLFGQKRYQNLYLTCSLNCFYLALKIANNIHQRVAGLAMIIKFETVQVLEYFLQPVQNDKYFEEKKYSKIVIKLTRNPTEEDKKQPGFNPGLAKEQVQEPLQEVIKKRKGPREPRQPRQQRQQRQPRRQGRNKEREQRDGKGRREERDERDQRDRRDRRVDKKDYRESKNERVRQKDNQSYRRGEKKTRGANRGQGGHNQHEQKDHKQKQYKEKEQRDNKDRRDNRENRDNKDNRDNRENKDNRDNRDNRENRDNRDNKDNKDKPQQKHHYEEKRDYDRNENINTRDRGSRKPRRYDDEDD